MPPQANHQGNFIVTSLKDRANFLQLEDGKKGVGAQGIAHC